MQQRVDKLVGHTEHLLDYLLAASEKRALLEPMIFDASVIGRHGSGRKSRGFNIIRDVLFRDCAKDVVNLAWDRDRRTPSVTNIMSALQNEPTRKELGKRHASGQSEFDTLYQRVCTQWSQFERQSWADGLRSLRDKLTAHLEVRKAGGCYTLTDASELNVKWGDVGRAMDLLWPIVLDLNLLVRNAGFQRESETRNSTKVAERYWGTCPANTRVQTDAATPTEGEDRETE